MPPYFNIYCAFSMIIISSSLQFIVQNKIVLLKVSQQLGWVLKVTNLRFASRFSPSLSGKIIRYSQEQDVQFPAAELCRPQAACSTAAHRLWSDTRGLRAQRWSNKQNCSWSSAINITLNWCKPEKHEQLQTFYSIVLRRLLKRIYLNKF